MIISESVSNLNISKAFNLCNEILIIPGYQRPFSWGKLQLKEMIHDILLSFTSKEPYSFGSVLLAKHIDVNKNRVLYVVDGQQRLCSFMFLLQAISEWTTNKCFSENILKLTKKIDHYGNIVSSIILNENLSNIENDTVVALFLELLKESNVEEKDFSNWLLDQIYISFNYMHFSDKTSVDDVYIYSLKRFISMNTKGLRLIDQEVALAKELLISLQQKI
jgi:uncharacterized protein with ParB-like and HNH nuclease domain